MGLLAGPTAPAVDTNTLTALAAKHHVPGAQIAIHADGQTVTAEAGEPEYRSGRRVTRRTAVPIGSISKSFTATTAMILVADGDLELDAPVGDYLPELYDLGAELTLRQLLSHTSGLTCGPDSPDISGATRRRYVADHCHRRNLVLPPGTGFSYSNMGYVLAGHLIETITGMSWWDAVESILLRPLGTEPAYIVAPGRPRSMRPVAAGHSVNSAVGRTRAVRQSLAPAEAPAGALALSAADLVSLGLLHVGRGEPELLPASYAEQMRQPVPGADPFGLADGWGLGLALFRHGDTELVGHDGNADGTSCYLRIAPARGCVVSLTSNSNTGAGMWQELLADLADAGFPIGPSRSWARSGPPAAPPSGCVGVYANGDVEYVVADRGGSLWLAVDGDPFTQLTFYDDLVFRLSDPASGKQVLDGRFMRDPATGRVRGIQLGGRLARRRHLAPGETIRKLVA